MRRGSLSSFGKTLYGELLRIFSIRVVDEIIQISAFEKETCREVQRNTLVRARVAQRSRHGRRDMRLAAHRVMAISERGIPMLLGMQHELECCAWNSLSEYWDNQSAGLIKSVDVALVKGGPRVHKAGPSGWRDRCGEVVLARYQVDGFELPIMSCLKL